MRTRYGNQLYEPAMGISYMNQLWEPAIRTRYYIMEVWRRPRQLSSAAIKSGCRWSVAHTACLPANLSDRQPNCPLTYVRDVLFLSPTPIPPLPFCFSSTFLAERLPQCGRWTLGKRGTQILIFLLLHTAMRAERKCDPGTEARQDPRTCRSVSYTHLTLPTKLSV